MGMALRAVTESVALASLMAQHGQCRCRISEQRQGPTRASVHMAAAHKVVVPPRHGLETRRVRTYSEPAMPHDPGSRKATTSGRAASLSNGSSPEPRGVSPASSGPAGPHFEAQVGASYLLALLTGGEPRGLPGMVIDRIELQRASEGRPLDDVIVHAHDASGTRAVLEIQVKREIAFSPADEVFRDVVQQIAAAARRPDFWTSRYQLPVATAKTSAKI